VGKRGKKEEREKEGEKRSTGIKRLFVCTRGTPGGKVSAADLPSSLPAALSRQGFKRRTVMVGG